MATLLVDLRPKENGGGGGGGAVDSVNGRTGAVILAKSDVGLNNVDNTSDANKPVSTATQTALNLKANLAGADFTGAISSTGEITAFKGTAKEINLGEHLVDLTGTSLETGGVIQATVGVSTTYSITDGSGIHVDHVNDEFMSCTWTGLTGITPGGAGSRTRYIFLEDPDNDGICTVYESGTLPTPEDRRNRIFLGQVVLNASNVIIAVVSYPVIDQAITHQLYDLASAMGIINIEGNTLSANGANLSINKSAGTLFVAGANYATNPNDPHRVAMASASPVTFQHMTQTAATGTNVTVISPGNYDVGGTITAIAGSNNQATNMRIYLFPSGNVRIAYGQTVYSTLTAAEAGIATESFVINPQVTGNGTLIGVLSVTKGCTDLSNTSTANFSPVSKFGEALAGATGGASTTTLQQAYDNSSANPEILTDATRGAVTLRRGSAADTDDVLEIQSNAGTKNFAVTGQGNVTAGTYNGYTPENAANKSTSTALGTSDTLYPTQNAVKQYVDRSGGIDPTLGFEILEHWIATTAVGNLGWTATANSGTNGMNTSSGDGKIMGIYRGDTSTSASSAPTLSLGNGTTIVLGGSTVRYEMKVAIPTLSDGTQSFIIRIGLHNATTSTAPTNGVFFEYDQANSANWRIRCAQNNTYTTTTTSTAVGTGWTLLACEINAAGTSAEFFVNGVSIGTVTTNIPTTTTYPVSPTLQIIKTLGTTSRVYYVDWFRLRVIY